LQDKNIHFLDMPLRNRADKEKPISDEDIAIVIIAKNKTTSGFAAGDLADPHGTHEVCLNTILQ
jgi:glucosamine-6-phosphate deaminase